MSRECELTGKGVLVGNNVSHANNKSKRRYLPNLCQVTLISDALGQRFRLRGRGLPATSGDRGNLYVVTQITIPKKLSDAERAIWQQLAAQRSS